MQTKALYTFVILGSLVAAVFFIMPDASPKKDIDTAVTQTHKIDRVDTKPKTNTIAQAWQWEVVSNDENTLQVDNEDMASSTQSETVASYPFTQESIYDALQSVKLDENGDIIIDNDALDALIAALDHSQIKLDAEALEALKDLIKKGLPGNAGEETAQIVADFYQYLGAEREFNALYEPLNDETQSIEDYETQYNELVALRSVYLGDDVANQLFATVNANSRYMFDSMKLEADTNLSDKEKKAQQAKFIEDHTEQTINVNNWNQRYQSFSNDKQNIIESSLSENEKREQLASLMHQHFNNDELKQINHLQLDSL